MTDWKEQAHLFANGQFKANTKYSINHRILGIIQDDNFLILEDVAEEEIFYEYANNCSLIARPISDMTDEEITKFHGWSQNDFEKDIELIENYASSGGAMDSDSFLYLLSIGCYPFDQKAFETGAVIDINGISQRA